MKTQDYIVLTGLKISCIIGIFDWERKQKQDVLIDMKIPCDVSKSSQSDSIADTVDYKKIAKATISFVEKSSFQLIETLAEKLATLLLQNFKLPEIELSVSKPTAIRGSENVGIKIHRTQFHLHWEDMVYLSLGSNVNPYQNLEFALKEISAQYQLQGLSHVYQTSPVGYSKQPAFWNMAAAIATQDPIEEVQSWLGALERKTGRKKNQKSFGPRTLDVDLIDWKNTVQQTSQFHLPHPDIATKAFVLFPLLEIAPHWIEPKTQIPLMELAATFKDKTQKIKQLPAKTFGHFPPQTL